MKSTKIVFVLAFSFLFAVSNTINSNAFYEGERSDKSPYVVQFMPSKSFLPKMIMPNGNDLSTQAYKSAWCSGSVIHPHIVITDAHCIKNEKISPDAMITTEWMVSLPGSTIGTNIDKASAIVATFFMSEEWYKDHGCDLPPIRIGARTCAPIGDIAAVVVKDPLPVPNNLRIATTEQIKNAVDSGSEVIGYGYGMTKKIPKDNFTPWDINTYPIVNYSRLVKNAQHGGSVPAKYGNVWPNFIITAEHKVNQSSCMGDSGGPFYLKENNFMYYIGTNAGTSWDMCQGTGWGDAARTWIASFSYHYDIYTQALDYVNTKLNTFTVNIEADAKAKAETEAKAKAEAEEKERANILIKQDQEKKAAELLAKINKNKEFARKLYSGKRCGKLNSTKTLREVTFTCIKHSKKLVWDNGV